MNPGRDDLVAAHSRINALEQELEAKNRIIKNLNVRLEEKNKPKKRVKVDRNILPKLFTVLKVSAITLPILSFLGVLALAVEPNDVFIADGEILEIRSKPNPNKKCAPIKDKDGRFIDCRYNSSPERLYGGKFRFIDKFDKEKTFSLEPGALADGDFHFPFHNITGKRVMLYLENVVPYVGCKVKVHYKIGRWFSDHAWQDNFVDASMCNKTGHDKEKR